MKKETLQPLAGSLIILLFSNWVWSFSWTALAAQQGVWVKADASPRLGKPPLEVRFTATVLGSAVVELYEWDFDGDDEYEWSSTTSGDTVHAYLDSGVFNAVLRVTAVTQGEHHTATGQVTISVLQGLGKKQASVTGEGRMADPWSAQGLVPYGQYFRELDEYVSPQTGLLTVEQLDLSIPGRGIDPIIGRIYVAPPLFTKDGVPALGYEVYPYASYGDAWQLSFPWIGQFYLHLLGGQQYPLTWTIKPDGSKTLENHEGDHFKLIQHTNRSYTLFTASGTRYLYDSARRLLKMVDRTGKNQLTFHYNAGKLDRIVDSIDRAIDLTYNPSNQQAANLGGSSSQATAGGSNQRKTFFDGTRHWAFYYNGSNTVYTWSRDGVTWNSPPKALCNQPEVGLWTNGTSVYAVWSTAVSYRGTVYLCLRRGTISDGEITWAAPETVSSVYVEPQYHGFKARYYSPTVAVDSGGRVYVAANFRQYETYGTHEEESRLCVWKSDLYRNTIMWTQATVEEREGMFASVTEFKPVLLPCSEGSTMMVVYLVKNPLWSIALRYYTFNPWIGPQTIDSTVANYPPSTCSDLEVGGGLHLLYIDLDGSPRYAAYNKDSWKMAQSLDVGGCGYPSITCSEGGELQAYWVRGDDIYFKRFNGTGWEPTEKIHSGSKPEYLTSPSTTIAGRASLLWTESGQARCWVQPQPLVSKITCGARTIEYSYSDGKLISVKDPIGRVTKYEYHAIDASKPGRDWLIKTIAYPTGGSSQYQYLDVSSNGRWKHRVSERELHYSTSGLAKKTVFRYDGGFDTVTGTQAYTSDGADTRLTVEFTFNDQLCTRRVTRDGAGVQLGRVDYAYNGNREVIREDIAPGASTKTAYSNLYRYDGWGNLIYLRDAAGHEVYRSYINTDTQNRFLDYQGNAVSTFTNSFYPNSVDPDIHSLIVGEAELQNGTGSPKIEAYLQYDYSGNLLQQKHLHRASWITVSRTYDDYGNPLTETDPEEHTTYYTYSPDYAHAYLTQVKNTVSGADVTWSYSYNLSTGNLLSITDPMGQTWSYQYDILNRITKAIAPPIDGVRTERRAVYDDTNNIITVYDENNHYTKRHYDGLARLIKTETHISGVPYAIETYSYNWQGQLEAVTDPLGNVYRYEYDALGRTIKTTAPDNSGTKIAYSDQNNTVSITNLAETRRRVHQYDWLSRLTSVREYIEKDKWYVTSYRYDQVGNLVQIMDAKNQTTTFNYDDLNRIIKTTYPDGTAETKAYDKVGRVVSATDRNGDTTQYTYEELDRLAKVTYLDGSTVTYTYDLNGNRVLMQDPYSSTRYSYDPRNRLLSETKTIDGVGYTVARSYDKAGNTLTTTYPDNFQATYSYDDLNRLTNVDTYASFSYSKDSSLQGINFGNQVKTIYTYNNRGLPTRILTQKETNSIIDLKYAYDDVGNIIAINEQTYSYDALDRLTHSTGPWGTLDFSYDPAGNRLTENQNGAITHCTYAAYNKLLQAGETTHSYDKNGNLIQKTDPTTEWTYAYDHESRLRRVSKNGSIAAEYIYDGDGNRIKTIENGKPTIHIHLGLQPIYEKDMETGEVTKYVFAGMQRIARITPQGIEYYHTDHLGSTLTTTDANGSIAYTASYEPFGTQLNTSGQETYTYTGKAQSSATGLYYFGARYYDPETGRFTTPDQFPGFIEDPQTLNRYTYCRNNPLRYIDPDGNVIVDQGPIPMFYPPYAPSIGGLVIGVIVGSIIRLGILITNPPPPSQLPNMGTPNTGIIRTPPPDPRGTADIRPLKQEEILQKNPMNNIYRPTDSRELLNRNRLQGKLAEIKVRETLIAEGVQIIGEHVDVRTDIGVRNVDLLVQTSSGELLAVEAKSGNAPYAAEQFAKDVYMATKGGTIISEKVPKRFRDIEMIIRTIVIRVPS